MSSKDVKLNLTITARDEAKAVVEQLARTMAETFDGLGARLIESMGLAKLSTAFEELKVGVNTAVESINVKPLTESMDNLSSAIRKVGSASKSVNKLGTALEEAAPKVKSALESMGSAITGFESIVKGMDTEVRDLTKNIITAFGDQKKAVESDSKSMTTGVEDEAKAFTSNIGAIIKELVLFKQEMNVTTNIVLQDITKIDTHMTNMGTGFQKTGTHIKESLDFMNLQMSGQMIESVGGKMVGFFVDAIKSAADYDQSIANTTASLNSHLIPATISLKNGIAKSSDGLHVIQEGGRWKLATDEVQKLDNLTLKLGQSGFFSASEVAKGMTVLANQGIDGQHILNGALQSVHDIAAANQQDFGETANVVSDIIHEMGGELRNEFGPNLTNQMQGIGNVMTATMHSGRMTMEDFLQTMKYVGPQAGSAGLSITDMGTSIALLAQHGIRGSQAGTTLRRELTNLLITNKETKATLDNLGISADDMSAKFFNSDGSMKSLSEAQQVLHDATDGLGFAQQQLAMKSIFGQYALSGMTAIARTAPAEFKALHKEMESGTVMQDILADKSKGLGVQLHSLTTHFETLQKEIGKTFKPVLEAVLPIINKVMLIFEHLSPQIKHTIIAVTAVTGVVMLAGGAFMAAVGTIGMFSGALGAGIGVLGTVASVALPVIAIIAGVAAVSYLVYEAWTHNFGGIQQKTAVVWSYLTTTFNAIKTVVVDTIMSAVKGAVQWWDELVFKFKNATGALSLIITIFTTEFKIAWETMQFIAKYTVDIIWSVIKAAFTTIRDFVVSIFHDLKNIVTGALKAITGIIDLFIDLLSGNWKAAWEDVKKIVNGSLQMLLGIFNGMWDLLKTPFVFLWDSIKNIFTSVAKDAVAWGSNVIDMFVAGISASIHKVTDAVRNVANSVKSFLGFHSPTKEGPASNSDQWMPNMMNMLHGGIVEHTPKIQSAVNNVALGLNTAFTGTSRTTNNVIPQAANTAGAGRGTMNITINVDGSAAKSPQHLGEMIAQAFRTQIPMVSA